MWPAHPTCFEWSSSAVSVLDATTATGGDGALEGFYGGFAAGGYGYLVPRYNSAGAYHGKVVRFDLDAFDAVEVLDATTATGGDGALKGFIGGFAAGGDGYLVPYANGATAYHGKVVRFAAPARACGNKVLK